MSSKINIFWFRRDLRLEDNAGLYHALQSGFPVLPVFIFDNTILQDLPVDDARVGFIYQTLEKLDQELKENERSLLVLKGKPLEVWKKLTVQFQIKEVYTNHDYEPYAIERDKTIADFLTTQNIIFKSSKDQVIFEKSEVVKDNGKPYTVFTPYKRKWLNQYFLNPQDPFPKVDFSKFSKILFEFPALKSVGFTLSDQKVRPYTLENIENYADTRDFPALDTTSYLSVHLRFGTVGIRTLVKQVENRSETFLSELIWREFFMQILYHFPQVVHQNFYRKFDVVKWRNNEADFKKWCEGKTGYPLVDAGMRQLNQTGYLHNRVRMVTASFLTKHLLIDWRWGEAYFAQKLLDYDLSANNGNWQWAAGTGCDAAPYFRIFNSTEQLKKFDKNLEYIKKWIPEFGTSDYPQPMVEHQFARKRALEAFGVLKSV